MKFGSVCSGIGAANVALGPLGYKAVWFAEVADFPSRVLKHHYPDVPNYGDMNNLPDLISGGSIDVPDVFCGGTPCQAFSLAGLKNGLNDTRGQLTLKFIEIADAIDKKRKREGKKGAIILWENVEGVIRDKTNAFGLFISGLAGLYNNPITRRWTSSGVLYGPKRNLAWRVLDAKYFGLPQQRRRLFLVATSPDVDPMKILFEQTKRSEELFNHKKMTYENSNMSRHHSVFSTTEEKHSLNQKCIENEKFEVFRDYTDCLYSSYGTKWNGNAAAYNGSLYVAQNGKVRRFTPVECERLMGFPDNYTNISGNRDTNRYQALGNSWAVPVIRWIGGQIKNIDRKKAGITVDSRIRVERNKEFELALLREDFIKITPDYYLNVSPASNCMLKGNIFDVLEVSASNKFYISSKGSDGILRRKNELSINMNERLEHLFKNNDNKRSVTRAIY